MRSRRVGISTFYRLLSEHGTASAALVALPEIAAAAGVEGYEVCPEPVITAELRDARKAGARLICIGTEDYPPGLMDLADPPPMLWVIGQTSALHRPMIGVVGARNASSLGLRMARNLAAALSEAGYVVVSGLARGIDAAAHQASAETGTVAVMAGGVDALYPPENATLADAIPGTGARLSEMPMGRQPQARHFPRRNRIIPALARALVVVEAAAKSGSLLTARAALDQGREVLAVPGHPFDARAAGGNMLIRDGAILVRSARDVIAPCRPSNPSRRCWTCPRRPRPRPATRRRRRRFTGKSSTGSAPPPLPRISLSAISRARPGTSHRPSPSSRCRDACGGRRAGCWPSIPARDGPTLPHFPVAPGAPRPLH
ncbi:DNA processing protein DprA, putative [Pseudooceanicola batsensis HTCC2597]|uniref:DNA processing protein DprA, putative n=1 Tax=Pseudooceanicola batsensis (strain ATCC BAA-863 / DSM 15984 / KCTC 12145 / HTCC2597) TaxID=252305 RepID=A3TZ48_PSEBH|nr:DNA processing protein DprA, putative [Pseudooceanicola batsensis HTCC2597]